MSVYSRLYYNVINIFTLSNYELRRILKNRKINTITFKCDKRIPDKTIKSDND